MIDAKGELAALVSQGDGVWGDLAGEASGLVAFQSLAQEEASPGKSLGSEPCPKDLGVLQDGQQGSQSLCMGSHGQYLV
jgi:hypothetical protein